VSEQAGRYRRLYVNEWHHPDFRRLNDGARVVRFYVTAGPQTTSVGCYRLSTALAVEDLGGTAEQFEERLATVCELFNWGWDPLARVIWIRDWVDWNPPASPNVVASWAKLLKNVPDCSIKYEAVASIAASLKNLPQSFREPFADLARTSPRPEVKTKVHSEVHSETNQGTGSREQRTESKRTGALRADGNEGKESKTTNKLTDSRLVSIARETLKMTNYDGPIDEDLIDSFRAVARNRSINDLPRPDIISALTQAQSAWKSA
jgi:hypothetical protein